MTKKRASKRKPVRISKKKKPSVAEIFAIGKAFRKHIRGNAIDDHAEFLYDENGLPK